MSETVNVTVKLPKPPEGKEYDLDFVANVFLASPNLCLRRITPVSRTVKVMVELPEHE